MSGTLPVTDSSDLTLGEAAFDDNSLCVVFVNGGRYGGDWSMGVARSAGSEPCGSFWVMRVNGITPGDPGYPDMVIETAFSWLKAQARAKGWRVLHWENLNSEYGPAERPYFALARAILGSSRFEPQPGVVYADGNPG
jgi:hypothetical protein